MRQGLVVGWILTCACVRLPDAPTLPTDDGAFTAPPVAAQEGMDDTPPVPMMVLPGDVLTIRAFSAEVTVHEGIVVDEQGNAHLPLVGAVDVGGRPLSEAEVIIRDAMRRIDRVVQVALSISDPVGHRATVVGAVRSPGRVLVTPGMRVADLIAAVEGPADTVEPSGPSTGPIADLGSARIVRRGRTLPISMSLALEGDPRHNVRVLPGDHLYVPTARDRAIVVLGAVGTPRVLAYRDGMRLTEALARSGGLNERGDRTDIHIVRGSLDRPLVYRASLRAIVNGNRSDVLLASGDILYVTEEWTAHVGEVLGRVSSIITDPANIALTAALLLSITGE
ncbi:MAG: SLBB domain-containing protein [Myxococcales bacterium]|nr:SLBB domain-containing protein [Myxococcales bacterium]